MHAHHRSNNNNNDAVSRPIPVVASDCITSKIVSSFQKYYFYSSSIPSCPPLFDGLFGICVLIHIHSFFRSFVSFPCCFLDKHKQPEVMETIQKRNDQLPGETYQHTAAPRTVSVLSAPMTYGQPYVGTDYGPTLLKEAGLLQQLTSLSWRVEDCPPLDFDNLPIHATSSSISSLIGKAKNHLHVGAGTKMLAEVVEQKLAAGRFPLILGGDHSIGIGSLAGILKAKPHTGVLWIDAHADLNSPALSESGNMHGMPIGFMMEGVMQQDEIIPGFEWLADYPKLAPDSLVYVGLRDVDAPERRLIRDLGIVAYTMTDIDRYGIGGVMQRALNHLMRNNNINRPLHLSFDIDAVDPILAPATGTKVRGGLTFREAHYVAEAVAWTGNLASAEIVELNPTLSTEKGANETIELGLQLLTSMMGKSII